MLEKAATEEDTLFCRLSDASELWRVFALATGTAFSGYWHSKALAMHLEHFGRLLSQRAFALEQETQDRMRVAGSPLRDRQ